MRGLAMDLRMWRATYDLSQQRAADLMNVSLKQWRRWERGEAKPTRQHAEDLRVLLAQPPAGYVRTEVPADDSPF